MSRSRVILSIASAFLLVTICSTRLRADDTTNAAPPPGKGSIDVPGQNFVHNYTGFTFPPMVGMFKRVQAMSFNANSSDVGVDYSDDPFTAHVSVSVYPAKTDVRPHSEQCRDEVSQVHPDARLVEEKPMTLSKEGASYDGLSALFSFQGHLVGGDEAQELLSKLIVFRYGDYFITYRFSYSKEGREATEKQLDDFIQQLDWPPPLPPTPTASPTPSPQSPTPPAQASPTPTPNPNLTPPS